MREAASRKANDAMTAEGSGTIRSRIKNLLRSPSIKLRRRSANARHKDDRGDKASAHARRARQRCDTNIL